MKKMMIAMATLGFCLSMSAAEDRPLVEITLVSEGNPSASIVVAQNSTPSAELAALELQYHIRKITGAILPIKMDNEEIMGIRILVGENKQTNALGIKGDDFKSLEYLIQFRPDTIILIGRDWQDTEKSRKELGRDTNGRTIQSSRQHIDYNKATGQTEQGAKTIILPGFFDDQGTCYATYHFLEQFCCVRWYGPTELNIVLPFQKALTVRGSEIRRSRDMKHILALGGGWPIIKVQWNNPNDDELNLYWRRLRIGGEKWAGNHTIWQKTIREVFNNPEYQAKGKGRGSQLCYTNPVLVQEVAQAARDYFDGKKLPDGFKAMGNYFAVVPDDNYSWCECENCRRILNISGKDKRGEGFFSNARNSYYIFHFINEVAKEVRKTHPHKFITTLAYSSYAYPPKGLELEPNISVAPCLHICYGYDKRTYYENDMAIYHAWLDAGDRPLYLWNYFHHPMEPAVIDKWNCFPCFMPDVISREIKRYYKDGIRGVFLCGIGQQLDYYLYTQTAFNVGTEYRQVVDEFFSLYFGGASEPMKKFYYRISDINREEGLVGTSLEKSWAKLGTPERMKELGTYIDEAVKLAKTDLEKRRVETWKKGVWEYMDTGYRQFYLHMEK
jgi:hypothetical protein